ncbi:MAG: hypothetical protein RSG52_03505 [Terrisporobacter sp.]|uniref:hypothetical protein n=1 Tax=Terrisporobacter sp. TaxID=1965305 RepID=UPI002FC846E2
MNQIISWICLISLCFLCLEVMIYICKDTLKLFNKVKVNNKSRRIKPVVSRDTYDYKTKIAK